jgi:PAS domain-containing protein
MQRGNRARGRIWWPPTLGLGVGLGFLSLAVVLGGKGSAAAAGPVLLVGLTGGHDLSRLLGWIGGGAVVVGALLWAVGTVFRGPFAPELLLGFGIAIGGGLGGVIRLLAVGEQEPETDETVTFERSGAGDADSTPEPRPADLFEESPDPILYFDDSGEGPVVRAVNPAFESVFGVTVTAVEGAALADASMATERVDDLVAAASAGEAFGETVACETATDDGRFRLTVAARTDDAGTRGYVCYTPDKE